MNRKTLIGLTAVAVVAAVIALYLNESREAVTERGGEEALFPALAGALNDISKVRIVGAGEDAETTLVRNDDQWGVAERGGYPADFAELRKQLLALNEARILEAKTSNPDFYSRLGVEDVAAEDAQSKLIEITAGEQAFALLVGNSNYRGSQSTYVRKPDEEQSWSVTGAISLREEPGQWLVKDVIDLPTAKVSRVELVHPDGDRVEIIKATEANPNFAVLDIPEGRELLSPSSGNSIAGALASLRLEDVVPAAEFEPGSTAPIVGVFETFGGLRAHTKAFMVGDQRYLSLEVEAAPELIPVPEVAAEPIEDAFESAPADADVIEGDVGQAAGTMAVDEAGRSDALADAEGAAEAELEQSGSEESDTDAQAAYETAVAEARERAADINQRVSGWVYEIPSYKYSNMTKRMEDLLKDLPEEDPAEE